MIPGINASFRHQSARKATALRWGTRKKSRCKNIFFDTILIPVSGKWPLLAQEGTMVSPDGITKTRLIYELSGFFRFGVQYSVQFSWLYISSFTPEEFVKQKITVSL